MTCQIRAGIRTLAFGAIFLGIAAQAQGPGAGPYTPQEVYTTLYDALRQSLQMPIDQPSSYFLGLTIVGSVVTADDAQQVNALANFCPSPEPYIKAFASEPKLDAIYERVIHGQVMPVRTYSPAYEVERRKLFDDAGAETAEYSKYKKYQDDYIEALGNFNSATSAKDLRNAEKAMLRIKKEWLANGYRSEIDNAFNKMAAEDYQMGATRTAKRLDVLEASRAHAIPYNMPDGFYAPVSAFRPAPKDWKEEDGWLKVSYSAEQTHGGYTKQVAEKRGFGGFNLGFVTIGGKGGSTETKEERVNEAYNLSYTFEIKRVSIDRPWLDTSIFFEQGGWTWHTAGNTAAFPYVAVPRDPATGLPVMSPNTVYSNERVALPLLPVEVIIARGISVKATVSKADYNKLEQDSKIEGAAFFSFCAVGGGGKSSLTKISEDSNYVTFMVETKGISVIGLVSQILPQVPNPNRSETWGPDAWLPTEHK